VKDGEKLAVFRSVTNGKLHDLFTLNSSFPRLPSTDSGERPWAGHGKRVMMGLLYAVSFLCLLRVDEALKLELRHFEPPDEEDNGRTKITLDFRKTAPGKGTKNLDAG
jgi:hypothetical protein